MVLVLLVEHTRHNGVDSYNGVIEVGKSYSLTYEVTENIDAATLYYYAGSFVSIAKDVECSYS